MVASALAPGQAVPHTHNRLVGPGIFLADLVC